MSTLALVTGRLAAGVWRPDSTPLDQLMLLAGGLGWDTRSGRIDSIGDKASFLTELGQAAGVPPYVRPNWDSVADGLRDIDLARRCVLAIDAPQPSPFDATAVEILAEAVAFWARNDRELQVVWFGPVGAPSLADVTPPKRSRARSVQT